MWSEKTAFTSKRGVGSEGSVDSPGDNWVGSGGLAVSSKGSLLLRQLWHSLYRLLRMLRLLGTDF